MKNEILFNDLSTWLKVAIISAWITAGIWILAFLLILGGSISYFS